MFVLNVAPTGYHAKPLKCLQVGGCAIAPSIPVFLGWVCSSCHGNVAPIPAVFWWKYLPHLPLFLLGKSGLKDLKPLNWPPLAPQCSASIQPTQGTWWAFLQDLLEVNDLWAALFLHLHRYIHRATDEPDGKPTGAPSNVNTVRSEISTKKSSCTSATFYFL